MAKNYKVKRYYSDDANTYRARPRLITVIFVVLLFAGLLYLGIVMYGPVSDFIANLNTPVDMSSLPEPEPPASTPEPAPEAEPEPAPEPLPPMLENMAAVYMPHAIAADEAARALFLGRLPSAGVNTVLVEIKNAEGYVLYETANEQTESWDLQAQDAIDLAALKAELDALGLSLAVKMSAFRDPQAASSGRTDYAITYQDSDFLWLDEAPERGGRPWLNPYSPAAAGYLQSLALEAIDLGARYVALENVQFPDNSGIYATFGDRVLGMSRIDILKSFVAELEGRAAEKSARIALWFPVTAVTRSEGQENRYGGPILNTVGKELALVLSPSQYGGGFDEGGLSITDPQTDPGAAVRAGISYARQGLASGAAAVAVLDPAGLQAQLAAARALGIDEYVIFSENGEYELGGGVSADTQP